MAAEDRSACNKVDDKTPKYQAFNFKTTFFPKPFGIKMRSLFKPRRRCSEYFMCNMVLSCLGNH